MALDQVKRIIDEVAAGKAAPVYFLMGEETYYIDAISQYIENNVLSEEERGFNQMVLYGRDVTVEQVIGHAKRFPMMSERQVIIVKEAQDLSRTIEDFVAYVEMPQPSTVLVVCFKYKKLDARKKLSKALKAKGVLFDSKKLYDNQLPDWIKRVLAGSGYSVTPKAAQMLSDYLGNDLSKIKKELDKLQLILDKHQPITPEDVETHIGISKDFNNFELQSAIAQGDRVKAFQIVAYFANNPKHHPIVMTVALMYSFFSKLLLYHSLSDKSSAPKIMGVNPFFIKEYQVASRLYSMKQVTSILGHIRTIDMKSKGVGASQLSMVDLLHEMLLAIFR
ncbi:MAG: DNA polymerase III subunit delta [Flavobacteriaceae bacterium]|nr:DNA polymerase III subunit delta [Flavobacteriaceae bacterium]MDG1961535.1 DNA polymerase III subunit delta [Flavobacteriaceae bacterium]